MAGGAVEARQLLLRQHAAEDPHLTEQAGRCAAEQLRLRCFPPLRRRCVATQAAARTAVWRVAASDEGVATRYPVAPGQGQGEGQGSG